MTGQDWELVGAPNARDLGGMLGAGGRRVRTGRLIRTPALGRLTDEDLSTLARIAPACVVDLRGDSEIVAAPPNRLVGEPRVVRLPVYDAAHPVFTAVSEVLLGHDLGAEAKLAMQGSPAAMAGIYRWFVTGEAARAGFGAAARLAADVGSLPLLFHCSAGKDRTGWLSVVLLTAVGVDEAAIRADYLRTNSQTESLREVVLQAMRARQPELAEAAIRPLMEVRGAYLDAAYDEVRRVHGSFDRYLRDGLGLTDAHLAALRDNLLD
ncbi:tyrosine-protein phosphatase [Micromonospora sp. NBC_01655]|uniref:tyrosine-protein phosphatase n=1 Tax=Micromonospora sp. NBC_01655 TaxID=2975983 RepID=UPI0022540ADD|nr:tyrosine-protein phosphatase [Micromonospora sp. NBC_01655]MCX4471106.1 tyrosine-protein phosphatase [Micromonospora sp. NBC_01655]